MLQCSLCILCAMFVVILGAPEDENFREKRAPLYDWPMHYIEMTSKERTKSISGERQRNAAFSRKWNSESQIDSVTSQNRPSKYKTKRNKQTSESNYSSKGCSPSRNGFEDQLRQSSQQSVSVSSTSMDITHTQRHINSQHKNRYTSSLEKFNNNQSFAGSPPTCYKKGLHLRFLEKSYYLPRRIFEGIQPYESSLKSQDVQYNYPLSHNKINFQPPDGISRHERPVNRLKRRSTTIYHEEHNGRDQGSRDFYDRSPSYDKEFSPEHHRGPPPRHDKRPPLHDDGRPPPYDRRPPPDHYNRPPPYYRGLEEYHNHRPPPSYGRGPPPDYDKRPPPYDRGPTPDQNGRQPPREKEHSPNHYGRPLSRHEPPPPHIRGPPLDHNGRPPPREKEVPPNHYGRPLSYHEPSPPHIRGPPLDHYGRPPPRERGPPNDYTRSYIQDRAPPPHHYGRPPPHSYVNEPSLHNREPSQYADRSDQYFDRSPPHRETVINNDGRLSLHSVTNLAQEASHKSLTSISSRPIYDKLSIHTENLEDSSKTPVNLPAYSHEDSTILRDNIEIRSVTEKEFDIDTRLGFQSISKNNEASATLDIINFLPIFQVVPVTPES